MPASRAEIERIFGEALQEQPNGQLVLTVGNSRAAGELIRAIGDASGPSTSGNGYSATWGPEISRDGNLVITPMFFDPATFAGIASRVPALVADARQQARTIEASPSFTRDAFEREYGAGAEYGFDNKTPRAGAPQHNGQAIISQGNFENLPEGLKQEALATAKEFRALATKYGVNIERSQEFSWAAQLDGRAGLSDTELASAALAMSVMGGANGPAITPRNGANVVFDGALSASEMLGRVEGRNQAPADMVLVRETARQIMGDLMQGQVTGGNTEGAEGNQPWIGAMNSSKGISR